MAAFTTLSALIVSSIASNPASASGKRKPAPVTDLLADNKIPPLNALQMSEFLHYLFSAAGKTIRIQVAEVAYRYDHGHPRAQDVFLACTLPLAETAARRRAHKLFVHPSDWQLELMYEGAVQAMIAVFQSNSAVQPGSDAFRRYLLRALALGAVRSYFQRGEYDAIRTVATHMWGRRRFPTDDTSKNSFWVALLTFGEGWHNNHHPHPQAARHGLTWYELDINWYGISALRMLGLAWDVKVRGSTPMKAEQQKFHGGFPSETKRDLSDLNTFVTHGHLSHLATRRRNSSVANKLICSNVVLFDPGTHKRLVHGRHHSGRPGNVVDGSLQIS
jgi:hypothetical protein